METKKFKGIKEVLAFLILEIFAFVSFSLGNSFIFYSLLVLVLTVLLFIFTRKQIVKEGISSFAIFAIPLFAFSLLTTLSNFTNDSGLDVFSRILMPISLTCFAFSGYLSSYYSEFKLSTFFLVVYSTLALLVILSFGYTMIQYTPFYTIEHASSYIYYDGKPSPLPIGQMAYFLVGFRFVEVDVSYLSYYASVLFSAVIPLFFIKYKENKKKFIIFAVCGLIGAITLIFTPTKFSLISSFLVLLTSLIIVLLGKSVIKGKWIKIAFIVFISIFSILFILLFINAQTDLGFAKPLQDFIAGNELLNRLFNANGLVVNYNFALNGLFSNVKLFGFPIDSFNSLYGDNASFSGSWIFDIILTSGLFGVFFFVIVLILGVNQLVKYYKLSNDSIEEKVMLVGYIFVTFVFLTFDYPSSPYIYYGGYMPLYLTTPFLICLFLFGYVFKQNSIKNAAKTEYFEENTEVTI